MIRTFSVQARLRQLAAMADVDSEAIDFLLDQQQRLQHVVKVWDEGLCLKDCVCDNSSYV